MDLGRLLQDEVVIESHCPGHLDRKGNAHRGHRHHHVDVEGCEHLGQLPAGLRHKVDGGVHGDEQGNGEGISERDEGKIDLLRALLGSVGPGGFNHSQDSGRPHRVPQVRRTLWGCAGYEPWGNNPNCRSPASPRPGTTNPRSSSSWSMAAHTTRTPGWRRARCSRPGADAMRTSTTTSAAPRASTMAHTAATDPPVAIMGSHTATRLPVRSAGRASRYTVGSSDSSSRRIPTWATSVCATMACIPGTMPRPARSTGTSTT